MSPSGLRRLAGIYSATYGDLPRDEADNRLWPVEAVERLEAARAVVAMGRAKTVKEALGFIDAGIEVDTVPGPPGPPPQEALEVLMGELRAIRQELAALREDNAALREQLALPAPQEKAREGRPSDGARLALLERRNTYLEEELRRRDEQPARHRPWWKVWER